MSYDIRLCDPVKKETILTEQPHQITGRIYAVGGTQEMWLNVTYNYSRWYYLDGVFPPAVPDEDYHGGRGGIRSIYNMSGAESIPVLKQAISALESCKEDISEKERQDYEAHGATGYWMPARENAIRPLYQLLSFAQMRPDGIWEGD